MIISTTTCNLVENDDFCAAVKMIKDAGFDAYDLSLEVLTKDENCRFNKDDYVNQAKKLREYADSIGIACNQSHGPFPTGYKEDDKTEWVFQKTVRAMEIAAVCGAKQIVVHPRKQLPYMLYKEKLKEINLKFYSSLVPYAKKFGIKVAIENMWGRDPYDNKKTVIVDSICSHPEEFCEYLDSLPKEHFTACLDIGHVVLTHDSLSRTITMLGHDRLGALHVHDNNLLDDNHTLPYLGKIPFDEVISALKSIDYSGDLTLETIGFDKAFPKELKPAALRFAAEVARHIADSI